MISKKLLLACLSAAMVCTVWAPASFAGITDSRHDVTNAAATAKYVEFGALVFQEFGACGACHIPHGAVGQRLFPNVGVGGAGGFFGPLCQTCHDTSLITNIDINTNATVLNGSHGLDITTILPTLGDHENVVGSGLPYTLVADRIDPDTMECISCHDVHNTAPERPFMQVDLDTLCETCHTNRENNATATTGFANAFGGGSTHPAGSVFTGDVSGIDGGGATADSPFVLNWGAELVLNPDVGTDGSTWTDTIWDSGMQLFNQLGTGAGGVDCISCHNAHWDEDDATQNNGTNYLAFVDDDLGVAGENNDFCEYCHQGGVVSGGGYWWNPGATTESHPNDDVPAAATITADLTWMPVTMSPVFGTAASGLVCTSCHGIHPADSTNLETELNSPIFLNYDEGTYGAPNVTGLCGQCHLAPGATLFNHHPTGGYITAGNTAGGVTCGGGDTEGYTTCHGQGGGANGAIAHNRADPLGQPDTAGSAMCVTCHTVNPSAYTTATAYTASGDASHFVGDVGAEGFARTTDCSATGIRSADTGCSDGVQVNWGTAPLPSLFGDDFVPVVGGGALEMICESCHRLAEGNLISGDGSTGMLLEIVGAAVPVGDSTVAYNYGVNPYLCAGCHLIPGGTHPLAEADETAYAIDATGLGETYVGAGLGLNCESCHSAHDAVTESGSFILDGGTNVALGGGTGMEVEPAIDYTTFCAVCHLAFE